MNYFLISPKVFVLITEIFWRTFWRNKWRSVFDVAKDSSYRPTVYKTGDKEDVTIVIPKIEILRSCAAVERINSHHWLRVCHKKLSVSRLPSVFVRKFDAAPKLYIPSTINIWKKVLTKPIWADKKWAGFWQISLYIK